MSTVSYTSNKGIAEIRIDRAEKYNVITHDVVRELAAAWQRFKDSDEDRVAILYAAGERAFTAGADLRDIPHDLWKAIPGVGIQIDKPIIAVTAGLVVGGGLVLVQFADLAVAADNSVFSYPEAKVGFSGGLISSLAARIPHKLAMELLLVGGSISAQRAYEAGLVNRVVPVGQQLDTARELAAQIAANAPLVTQTLKRFVGEVIPKGPTEAAGIARAQIEAINASEDFHEGISAFTQKRAPQFVGR